MSTACPACLKTNPPDAQYCYYDGRSLSKAAPQGPLTFGTLPFPMPFYFSDGQGCATSISSPSPAMNAGRRPRACSSKATGRRSSRHRPTRPGGGRIAGSEGTQPRRRSESASREIPRRPGSLALPKLAVESPEKYLGLLSPGSDHIFELMISQPRYARLAQHGLLHLRLALVRRTQRRYASLKMFQRATCSPRFSVSHPWQRTAQA